MVRRLAGSLCTVVAVVAASAPAVQAAAPGHHRGQSLFWGSVTRPALDQSFAQLSSVAAVSADDVWAVGDRFVGHRLVTLIQHWDGTSWRVVPSPNPVGAQESFLNSVAAVSANNVWAVGLFYQHGTGSRRTLVEHWNGTTWRRVPSPNPSVTLSGSLLTSVSAVSADDVWAVGYYDPPGSDQVRTLAMRWNGGSWSVIRTPVRPGVDRGFFGVSATSASNGWAVGATVERDGSRFKSLTEHWNGQRWSQAPIGSPGGDFYVLSSVSLVAPGNVWAVGLRLSRFSRPLVEHRYAGSWHQVRPPGLGGSGGLVSVSGSGPDDVWMVGRVDGASVLEHWDGHSWSRFRGLGATTADLQGVTAQGSTATWAVGTQNRRSAVVPFEERWNGHVWTR